MADVTSTEFVDPANGKKSLNTRSQITDVGKISQARNRIRTGLAETYAEATNTITFPATANVTEVTSLVTATDSAVAPPASTENYVLVAVNAPNATVAASWLTQVDSQDSDAQVDKFLVGERYTIRVDEFSDSVITRLDYLPVDVAATLSAIHLWAGGH